ncbi:MAG: hypothetical protein O3A29_09610 [Planctomycetota bacterium]|nr:hypothetical protein [Planctomycetota bacterium]
MSDGPTIVTSEPPPSTKVSIVEWLISSVLALTVIGIVAVNLPARVKLLGWFAIAVGLLAGGVLRYLQKTWGLSPGRRWTILAAVLIVTLQSGIGVGTWWRQAAILDKQNESHPILQQLQSSRIDAEAGGEESHDQQEMLQYERLLREDLARERSFERYLQKRLTAVGSFDRPWPALVWCLEVLAGTFAGTYIFCRPFAKHKGSTQ